MLTLIVRHWKPAGVLSQFLWPAKILTFYNCIKKIPKFKIQRRFKTKTVLIKKLQSVQILIIFRCLHTWYKSLNYFWLHSWRGHNRMIIRIIRPVRYYRVNEKYIMDNLAIILIFGFKMTLNLPSDWLRQTVLQTL